MMHFPSVSDFPLLFPKIFLTPWKISQILPFPEKISDFQPPKFLTTFFLVIDHKFRISPLFGLFHYISPPDWRKLLFHPYFHKFPPCFGKIHLLFTCFLCNFSPPNWVVTSLKHRWSPTRLERRRLHERRDCCFSRNHLELPRAEAMRSKGWKGKSGGGAFS